ncbi:MAG TPA: twin-arginine translocase TatA/TatE family subunit [Planctomycetota bacterium]|nr:twin-arginine translocase TatA/TatE family subunit [Planctomycetota bacterium]
MGRLSPMELLLVVTVLLLLFGTSKIPQLMRSLGSGLTEFKKGLREGSSGGSEPPKESSPPAP